METPPIKPKIFNRTLLASRACAQKSVSKISRQSFTLIELLLVVVLLGVVAGLAVPNFSNTYVNFQLSETAKNISALMQYAQSRSIIKGVRHQMELDPSFSKYWLTQEASSSEDEEGTGIFERIPGRFGRMFAIPQDIAVESEDPKILFYPDGKIDKIRIYLHNKKGDYFTITTEEQAGQVQILDFKIE